MNKDTLYSRNMCCAQYESSCPVLFCFPVALVNTTAKSYLGEERFILLLEVKAGASRQELKQRLIK